VKYIVPGPSKELRNRMKAMLKRRDEEWARKKSESMKQTLKERKQNE